MSTLEAAVPLTKSQKKRLKRNKAKTRKAAAAAEEVTVVPATPVLDPLNSHDALRIGLQNLGFELSDIDRSIEEMWNLGLDYSDINDVATFMTNEKASAATSAAATSVVKDVQVDPSVTEVNSSTPNSIVTSASTAIESSTSDIGRPKRAASEEEVKTVSTAMDAKEPGSPKVPLTVTKNGQPVSAETQTKHTNTNAPSIATNGHGHSNGSSNNNVAKSKRNVEAKQAPPTLKMKLNVVANDENLTDAIVALTEWIVKAATPTEVKELCNGAQPCALRTVVHRVIVAPGPRSFSGQLLDLIGSILRIAGIPSTELSSSARALMHTLTKAKSVHDNTDINTDDIDTSIADFVADTVTSFISESVKKMTSVSAGATESLEQLDSEIASLKSAQLPNDSNVGGLVAKRDHLKTLTQKYSNILSIKMCTVPKEEKVSSPSGSISEISKDDMMASVFGNKLEKMNNSKTKYDDLKKRQVESHSSLTERQTVVSKIKDLKANKGSIAQKIMEMELELKKLNEEEKGMDKQISKAEDSLVILDDSLSAEAKEVEKLMSEVSHNMKLNDSVSDVVESLQDFQSEMRKAASAEIRSVQANIPETNLEVELPPRMGAYIASMSEYLNTEYKLVSFLQRRSQNLRDSFPRLEMEIEECKALGMTNNVVEMEKKLNQMQQNIMDDDNITKALQKEAKEMKDGLSDLIKEYKSTGADMLAYEASLKGMNATINAIL